MVVPKYPFATAEVGDVRVTLNVYVATSLLGISNDRPPSGEETVPPPPKVY